MKGLIQSRYLKIVVAPCFYTGKVIAKHSAHIPFLFISVNGRTLFLNNAYICSTNRHERVNLFMLFYHSALYSHFKYKCIDCYFYAENSIDELTGSGQYSSYASFRASMSRREKMKRLALKNK